MADLRRGMEMTEEDALKAYARMMNTLDVRHVEHMLADDFRYASQMVLEEITSRVSFLDYVGQKLEAIAASDDLVYAEMGVLGEEFGKRLCVVLAQGDREILIATVLAEARGGLITRLDVCVVPSPQSAVRTGDYPT